MPRLRQNDLERAMGMVQVGVIHQVVANHFNVSRITISRLMIRLRQTGTTNDRPRNDRPRVTSQRRYRHLRLIHLRNRMITARRIPGLGNVRILGETVRKRLRESGIRARPPVVGPILKPRHRTARLAWARGRCRWRLHTWQHIPFSDEFRLSLCFSDGRYLCIAGVATTISIYDRVNESCLYFILKRYYKK